MSLIRLGNVVCPSERRTCIKCASYETCPRIVYSRPTIDRPSVTRKRCRRGVTTGAHAIIILDQAGWHGTKGLRIPSNISLLPLPPCAPEPSSQENIWQFMRQNWLSNRVFKTFDDIVDHCCYAWNRLIDQPWKIMSIARRDWAIVGQSF